MSSEVFLEISFVLCCFVWEFCTLLGVFFFLLVRYVFQICVSMIFVYLCLYIYIYVLHVCLCSIFAFNDFPF